MLNGILNPVGGLTGSVFGSASALYGETQDIAEVLAPGSMEGRTLTGNLFNENGVVGDLLRNAAELNVSGAVLDTHANIFAKGGVINNLADGWGTGAEDLLGNTLGIADGFLGIADGIIDGEDGLLG